MSAAIIAAACHSADDYFHCLAATASLRFTPTPPARLLLRHFAFRLFSFAAITTMLAATPQRLRFSSFFIFFHDTPCLRRRHIAMPSQLPLLIDALAASAATLLLTPLITPRFLPPAASRPGRRLIDAYVASPDIFIIFHAFFHAAFAVFISFSRCSASPFRQLLITIAAFAAFMAACLPPIRFLIIARPDITPPLRITRRC